MDDNIYKEYIDQLRKKIIEIHEESSEKIEEIIERLKDYHGWYPETVVAEAAFNILCKDKK